MTRASLGHTGRPLRAGLTISAAYVMVSLAALTRVGIPFLGLDAFDTAIWLSSGLWITAFGLFSILFFPILTRSRVVAGPA